METGTMLIALPGAVAAYAYGVYPLLLSALGREHSHWPPLSDDELPQVSISVPVYNEKAQIRDLIESLLRLDYPVAKRQILIISDASTDGTDDIVREYADRGVELFRATDRRGKTAAEMAGAPLLRGEIVVNTDASIRIAPEALRRLVAPFRDPRIGLASGRDVSVARGQNTNNVESGYVGYEMWVRKLETGAGGIIGASGCFYAIRAHLHSEPLPEALSRDFASALITREHGLRAVSVNDAICYVPRTASPIREYRRKVRTIMRGMETLAHKGHLLNPFRHPAFAAKLFSHKICRWLLPWTVPVAMAGLALESDTSLLARVTLALAVAGIAIGIAAWRLGERVRLPRPIAICGYLFLGNFAVIHATLGALRGNQNPVWEPTRRDPVAVN